MGKPTRKDVKLWKYESAYSPLHDHALKNHNRLICIIDAYLELREEVERDAVNKRNRDRLIQRLVDDHVKIKQLEDENQALKEDNTLLDVKLRELRIEYRKLESYLAEREGYQP